MEQAGLFLEAVVLHDNKIYVLGVIVYSSVIGMEDRTELFDRPVAAGWEF